MDENYIVINGKRTELTDEQLKALGIEIRKNPFERCAIGEKYVTILANSSIREFFDNNTPRDNDVYSVANYFNDETFAKQLALHQLLYRKLLKFAYDNRCEASATWDGNEAHYSINYVAKQDEFIVVFDSMVKSTAVYFCSEHAANTAINDVIFPFIAEHPEFIW